MQFDFLDDFTIPKVPPLPNRIMLQASEQSEEVFIKLNQIAKFIDCFLPYVEFAFGGFENLEIPNPVRHCEQCKKAGFCPKWSLNHQRWSARCKFSSRLKDCEKKNIETLQSRRLAVNRAAQKAREFERAYSALLSEFGGEKSFFMLNNIKTGEPIHQHPTLSEISNLSDALRGSSQNSFLAKTKKPDLRGGKNLKAIHIANRVAVLFALLKKPIGPGKNPITLEPSTLFARTVKFAFDVFDCGNDWDKQSQRAARAFPEKK